jgi:MFS family permease
MFTISRIQLSKVAMAASIGSLIEWYDFFIAGTAAATVWPIVFFPKEDPISAIVFSISTFALIYFSRPLAAFLFGHFGDKIGRKSTLVWTLIVMAVGMFGIALTPSYSSIGVVAPILIAIFRFFQGLGIGGEWQGAIVWLAEFAPKRTRGFWISLVQLANPLGICLGTLVFIWVVSVIPSREDFLNYGWRIPFLIGGLVVIVGFIIRYRMMESPLFKEIQNKRSTEVLPSIFVWKAYWPKILLFAVVTSYVVAVVNLNLNPFGITYMTAKGLNSTFVLLAVGASAVFGAIAVVLGGVLSDKIGRRRALLISTALTAVALYPFYLMVNTLVTFFVIIALFLLYAIIYLGYGVYAITFAEHFPTKFRYSGVGWAFQIGAVITGVLLVVVVPTLVRISGGPANIWPYLILLSLIITLAALAASLTLREPLKDELTITTSGHQQNG